MNSKWTIFLNGVEEGFNDTTLETGVDFSIKLVQEKKACVQTTLIRDCWLSVDCDETKKHVREFVNKDTILSELGNKKYVRRQLWLKNNLGLTYELDPYECPDDPQEVCDDIVIIMPDGTIHLEANRKEFWEFFETFYRSVAILYLSIVTGEEQDALASRKKQKRAIN